MTTPCGNLSPNAGRPRRPFGDKKNGPSRQRVWNEGDWEPPPARQRRRCGVLSMKTSEPNKNATNPQHQFEVRFSILPLCSQSLARRMPLSLSFTLSTNNHFAVALIVPFLRKLRFLCIRSVAFLSRRWRWREVRLKMPGKRSRRRRRMRESEVEKLRPFPKPEAHDWCCFSATFVTPE